jgi:predicted double-glycine peptidase
MKRLTLVLLSALALHADVPIIEKETTVNVPVKSWTELRNDGVVKQQYDFSCGASSMATVLRHFYNQDVHEQEIVNKVLALKGVGSTPKQLTASDFALSFADLAEYAKTRNFKGVGVAMDIDGLRKLRVPVIIYVKIRKFEHFTVFKGIDDEFVYLADPSFGNMKVKIPKFLEMFYQRDDLKYPGRVLAIIPVDPASVTPNEDFMETQSDSGYLYDLIESRIDQ